MKVVENKKVRYKNKILRECPKCNGATCPICLNKVRYVDEMANANIPVAYWGLKFSQFNGPENLKQAVQNYLENLEGNYDSGKGLCFVGQYGTGKTYSICSVLKTAIFKGYSVYYTSLLDVVHYMRDYKYMDEFYQTVTRSDFLAIDEVDSRHFGDSDQAQQFFGSNLERIVRYRTQNSLPVLLASNNASLEEVFTGQYKRVIDSLMGQASQVVVALGKDYRKKKVE